MFHLLSSQNSDVVSKQLHNESFDLHFIGAHELCATAATNALDHQADIAKVQEWLGHGGQPTFKVVY